MDVASSDREKMLLSEMVRLKGCIVILLGLFPSTMSVTDATLALEGLLLLLTELAMDLMRLGLPIEVFFELFVLFAECHSKSIASNTSSVVNSGADLFSISGAKISISFSIVSAIMSTPCFLTKATICRVTGMPTYFHDFPIIIRNKQAYFM